MPVAAQTYAFLLATVKRRGVSRTHVQPDRNLENFIFICCSSCVPWEGINHTEDAHSLLMMVETRATRAVSVSPSIAFGEALMLVTACAIVDMSDIISL